MSEQPLENTDDTELDALLSDLPGETEMAPTASEPIQTAPADEAAFVPQAFQPESVGETTRKSGLAWSAGIVFFSSIAFMLFLGWGADMLLGSRPWGLVGGVVVGSIVGFVQFFRITSQIFPSDKSRSDIRPLFGPDDDDDSPGV